MTDLKEAHRIVASRLCSTFRQEANPGTVRDVVYLALKELEAQGWVLVPKEATEEMMMAAFSECQKQGVAFDEMSPPIFFGPILRAMISARPTLEGEE